MLTDERGKRTTQSTTVRFAYRMRQLHHHHEITTSNRMLS